jgi:hypothetical protein
MVLQKVHVENFFQNVDKNVDVSFPSTFFSPSRFRVFLSDGSSKTPQKPFTQKIVSKRFYKKKTQFLFNHVFGLFSVRGAFLGKNTKKISGGNKSDPGSFLASDPPSHHPRGSPVFNSGWRLAAGGWRTGCPKNRAPRTSCSGYLPDTHTLLSENRYPQQHLSTEGRLGDLCCHLLN